MENPWVAILLACFLWWFLTGLILFIVNWADNRGVFYRKFVTLGLLPLFVLGFYGFLLTLKDTTVGGIYVAFLSSLCIWGWLELAFLSGLITGPNRVEKPFGIYGIQRFRLAWAAIAYSELILAAVFLALLALSFGELNLFGFLTFLVLYFARLSAKLNLFFGVPKINVEFLPTKVSYLASHFKVSGASWFFPLSMILLSGLNVIWLNGFINTAEMDGIAIGYCFLTTLTSLAILEHFFMVASFPDAVLWRWIIPKSDSNKSEHQVK